MKGIARLNRIIGGRNFYEFPSIVLRKDLPPGFTQREIKTGWLSRVVFLQILDQDPFRGFRVHISAENERAQHRVTRQELGERVFLRRVDFQVRGIGGKEIGFGNVPWCADELEHVSSGGAIGSRPDTWDTPQRRRRDDIFLWLTCRRRQRKEQVVGGR